MPKFKRLRSLKLPSYLKPFFWDVEFGKLDSSKNAGYIIQRLIGKGNDQAIIWMKRNFPESMIKDTLTQMRDFNEKTGNFWSLVYNIPRSKMACLQQPYLKMRRKLWPY